MFTKEQIDKWIEIDSSSENHKEDQWFDSGYLKKKLVEAKFLVDRWDVVITDIVVHPSHKDSFKNYLNDSIYPAKSSLTDTVNFLKTMAFVLENKIDINNTAHEILDGLSDSDKELQDHIWGATIHYSDHCPVHKGLMISYDHASQELNTSDFKSISTFPM